MLKKAMEQASIVKCLTLLRAIREAAEKYDRWPELEKEIDELITSLEEELSNAESLERERRLKALLIKAKWWLSILFDLLSD